MKINKDIIKDLKNKKIIYLIIFIVVIVILAFFIFIFEKEIKQPVEPIIEKTPEQLRIKQQTQELEVLMKDIVPLTDKEIIQQTQKLEELFQQIRQKNNN